MPLEVGKGISSAILFALGVGVFLLGLRLGGLWIILGSSGIGLCVAITIDVVGKTMKHRLRARRA